MLSIAQRFALWLALLAASLASPAYAQGTPVDLPAYSEVLPVYNTTSVPNVQGDGTPLDTAPAWDNPPIDGSLYVTSDITPWNDPGPHDLVPYETTYTGGTKPEAKFRLNIGFSIASLSVDPVVFFGQHGVSHCHTFMGNQQVTPFSTYATLRTSNGPSDGSLSDGGDLNRTAYWMPCMIDTSTNEVLFPDAASVYYQMNPAIAVTTHPIPDGLRYVSGFNVNDHLWLKNKVDAANAAQGRTRYGAYGLGTAYGGLPTPGSYAEWLCNGVKKKYFVGNDGSDPFGGACTAGNVLNVAIPLASCWDGVNLHSDSTGSAGTGYSHVIHEVTDTDGSFGCPDGWFRLPQGIISFSFDHNGFDDYKNWRLASDLMPSVATMLGRTPHGGETMHTDWMDGWDRNTKMLWQCNVIGMEILESILSRTCIPHELTTVYDTDKKLNNGGGTTRPTLRLPLPTNIGAGHSIDVHGN